MRHLEEEVALLLDWSLWHVHDVRHSSAHVTYVTDGVAEPELGTCGRVAHVVGLDALLLLLDQDESEPNLPNLGYCVLSINVQECSLRPSIR